MEVAAPLDDARRVLCGVRPCDLKGIALLDQIQTEGVPDPYYLARRARTTIVAYRCAAPCDARAFCAAVDSLDHDEGADVLLTPLGSAELLVTARTPAGAALVADAGFDAVADGPARRVGAVAARQEPFGRALPRKVSALPAVLAGRYKSALWEKHVARCFSCGTCNLVCPTCYCFDVKDDLALDTVSGTRHRTLDACMLPHFAEVAGGHNFRPEPAARQRHRVKRKFEYLPARLGAGSACVGCGRCGRQCTAGIDIYDIVCDLVAEESKS
jgi:ferredoxin